MHEDIDLLTEQVIACAIEVHRQMGAGLNEGIYGECMIMELAIRGIPFEAGVSVAVSYKGNRLRKHFEIDLLVDKRLIVELKAVEALHPAHQAPWTLGPSAVTRSRSRILRSRSPARGSRPKETTMTRTLIAALACLIGLSTTAFGQEPQDLEQQIRQLEEARRQAVLRNDVDTLARLYADQMTTVDIRGEFHTNNDLAAPRLNEPATRTTTTWAPDEMKIRIFGDTAVVTQRARIVDEIRGEARSYTARLTHVWVRHNGRWQLVARQATRVASN